jgi:hypothetical protein
MVLTLGACCSFALLVLGLLQFPKIRERSHSLSRVTTYASYASAREDTLSNADLWERKVDQGFSEDEALVYTAMRPSGSITGALLDSASRLRTSWHRDVSGRRFVLCTSWGGAAAILALMWLALWSWLGARRRLTSA